jgi:Ni/Fe-hydrogenase subunit HybB-like protein
MNLREKSVLVLAVVVLLGLVAVGAYAYVLQVQQGDVVTGMRSVGAGGAAWGLYIVMDGCFLGSGIALMAIACIARFSRHRYMEAAARIAMPFSIACFLGASMSVLCDQGRPLAALFDLAYYGRPQSPMFVTFTTVTAICLFGSLLHWVLARRPDLAEYAKRPSAWQGLQRLFAAGYQGSPGQRYRRRKAGFWMSLFMLIALLAPATALAILFVVRPSRTLDLVLLEVAGFLLLSLAGGIGLLALAAALVEKLAGREAGLPVPGYTRLGRWLLVSVSLSLLTVVAAEVASVKSQDGAVVAYGWALLGSYALEFWGGLAGLFVAAALLLRPPRRRQGRVRAVVLAGILVEVSVFLHHYGLLLAWQTHGLALPYSPGAYRPTWIEWAVVFGIVAVSILLLLPAVKLVPFAPLATESRPSPKPARDSRRSLLTWIWIAVGLAVSVAGFLGSARVGTDPSGDPALAKSPAVFIVGLMMLATAGALYELLPERATQQGEDDG